MNKQIPKVKRISPDSPEASGMQGLGVRRMFSEDVGHNKFYWQCVICKNVLKFREAAEKCNYSHKHKNVKSTIENKVGDIIPLKLGNYKITRVVKDDKNIFHYECERVTEE